MKVLMTLCELVFVGLFYYGLVTSAADPGTKLCLLCAFIIAVNGGVLKRGKQ